jgi:hypothetical protein
LAVPAVKTYQYAIAAVRGRRATMAGEIQQYHEATRHREDALAHLDASLRLLDPKYRTEIIVPKRGRVRSSYSPNPVIASRIRIPRLSSVWAANGDKRGRRFRFFPSVQISVQGQDSNGACGLWSKHCPTRLERQNV